MPRARLAPPLPRPRRTPRPRPRTGGPCASINAPRHTTMPDWHCRTHWRRGKSVPTNASDSYK
eukprot:2072314-Alexandrium_andersonii.AAC.1